MKKVFVGIIIAITCVLLVGCGKDLSDYQGTYVLEFSKYVGDVDTATDNSYAEMVLESDGTGKSIRNSVTYDIEWSIDGEDVTIKENSSKIEYNGTLKDNKLDIFDGDKENALTKEMIYIKR